LELKGKGVVITGGASGIGLATALLCAARGARVILSDIDGAAVTRARARVAEIAELPVTAVPCDVADAAAVDRLAEAAFADGAVYLLFNNAGVGVSGPLARMSQRDWDWVMGVNLWGPVNGIRSFLPRMIAQREGGHILINASFSGLVPSANLGTYAASKAAAVALAEVLRQELRETGVGVSVVCPMRVDTDIGSSARNRAAEERAVSEAADVTDPRDDRVAGEMISAEEAALRILDGVARNDPYIMTHAEGRPYIARRFARIDSMFDRQHPVSKPA
jgi:NAD(P)-dependent dehydrogenase (short-subunit alcohol dehydrogenase family)